jgi:hypothetical protein
MRRSNGVTAMVRDAQRLPRPVELRVGSIPVSSALRWLDRWIVGSFDCLFRSVCLFVCVDCFVGFSRALGGAVSFLVRCVCRAHSSERRRRLGVEQLRRDICSGRPFAIIAAVPCGAVPFRSMQLPWPCRGRAVGVTAATVPGRHCRRCRCAVAFCAVAVAFRAS